MLKNNACAVAIKNDLCYNLTKIRQSCGCLLNNERQYSILQIRILKNKGMTHEI